MAPEMLLNVIEAIEHRFVDALLRVDAGAILSLYEEGARSFLQGGIVTNDGSGIALRWEGLGAGALDAVTEVLDADGRDDLGYGVTEWSLLLDPEALAPCSEHCIHIGIYRRQEDGSWKIHVDCFIEIGSDIRGPRGRWNRP